MYQIGWFSTGRDKAARDLLQAVQSQTALGIIDAEIAFVFCNREPGESVESDAFLQQVNDYHIPLVCFSYQKLKKRQDPSITNQGKALPQWRFEYDREVIKRLQDFSPDLCVLAGYMLIVGREMCQRYSMINLHPAAPGGPTGTWQEVIWQLIETNAKQTGVMMHLVTPELDKGPPVTYCTFPIRGKPFDEYWDEVKGCPLDKIEREQGEDNRLFRLIRQHGLVREFPLIISTIQAFSQGRVKVTADRKIIDAEGRPVNGYNLTEDIDKQINKYRLR